MSTTMSGWVGPEAYERGLAYWPYGQSLDFVLDQLTERARHGARVLDIMCGTGYLLRKIAEARPDLNLTGVDLDVEYVRYGLARYPRIWFEHGDVRVWQAKKPFDIVLCTGALHHVHYAYQEEAVKNLASLTKNDGIAIIADSYVSPYEQEFEKDRQEVRRKVAAVELGAAYLKATIEAGAPDDVIAATVKILEHDVLMREYKMGRLAREIMFGSHFETFRAYPIWPMRLDVLYGDCVHVCSHQL